MIVFILKGYDLSYFIWNFLYYSHSPHSLFCFSLEKQTRFYYSSLSLPERTSMTHSFVKFFVHFLHPILASIFTPIFTPSICVQFWTKPVLYKASSFQNSSVRNHSQKTENKNNSHTDKPNLSCREDFTSEVIRSSDIKWASELVQVPHLESGLPARVSFSPRFSLPARVSFSPRIRFTSKSQFLT